MNRGDGTVALFLSLLLAGCMAGMVQPPARPTASPVASVSDELDELEDLINAHRKKVGCKELDWDDDVADVAQKHSDDMVKRSFFAHINPDGLTPFKRLERAGVHYMRAAENIAAGQRTAREVMNSWLNSPGHRRNIEDCAMREHGIGLTRGRESLPYGTIRTAWTHVFIAE